MPVASFLIDPATGAATRIDRPAIWRPVVDPTNRSVVFWTGDQALDPATNTWVTTSGRLVSADWQALSAVPATSRHAASGSAGQAGATDWDVRWDPSGRHLAVWIADATDPSIGRLSLYAVNADGTVATRCSPTWRRSQASRSAAIGWPGPARRPERQGSTISVYAWSDTGSGSMYGAPDPGSDPIVRRALTAPRGPRRRRGHVVRAARAVSARYPYRRPFKDRLSEAGRRTHVSPRGAR